eukprot:1666333-Pleurochrysis_carterae.AAC.1
MGRMIQELVDRRRRCAQSHHGPAKLQALVRRHSASLRHSNVASPVGLPGGTVLRIPGKGKMLVSFTHGHM